MAMLPPPPTKPHHQQKKEYAEPRNKWIVVIYRKTGLTRAPVTQDLLSVLMLIH